MKPMLHYAFRNGWSLLLADTEGTALLAIAAVLLVAGIVALMYVSRVTPKGTLLAVAVGLWVLGGVISPGNDRLMHLLGGLMRFLGFVGVILGIIDLLRRRK